MFDFDYLYLVFDYIIHDIGYFVNTFYNFFDDLFFVCVDSTNQNRYNMLI